MSVDQSGSKVKAVSGVGITIPDNFPEVVPVIIGSYADATNRATFTKGDNGQYPRAFRFLNTAATYVDVMFNSARFTAAAKATVTVGTGGTNSITLEAVTAGVAGNSITYTGTDPAGATQPLTVSVVGTDIDVSYETDGGSSIVSTSTEVAAAIAALPAAAALITATVVDVGTVAAVSVTSLADGYDADSALARAAAYVVEEAKTFPTASGVCRIYAGKEKSFTLGQDIVDMVIVAESAAGDPMSIEYGYESETIQ